MSQPTTTLRLAEALGHQTADRRIEILRRIGELGSISEAARATGISYKAAWQAIETLGNLAGQPLLDKAVGGSGGGGARLTPAGEHLLAAAEALGQARERVLASLTAHPDAAALAAGLGLRTSMRNQLPCRVAALAHTGASVSLTLALAGGTTLRSRITAESAELLGLAVGLPAIALFKATAVRIVPGDTGGTASEARSARDATNVLAGVVSRGGVDAGAEAELAITLPGGLGIVGFAHQPAMPAVGEAARALVEASAVVIALGG